MAITLHKFSKLFWGSVPLYHIPLKLFLFLNLPRSNSARKNVKMRSPSTPLKKNSDFAPYTKHFLRAYLRPFPGVTSLHVVGIIPNLKPHVPPKFSGIARGDKGQIFQ